MRLLPLTAMLAALGLAACQSAIEPEDRKHELGCVAGMMSGGVIGGLVAGPLGAGAGVQIGDSVGGALGVVDGTSLTCDPGKQARTPAAS